MDGGMFEVAVGGDGLKHLGIDAPSTAAELLDERWRDGAEFEIGGVKVSALQRHVGLAFGEMIAILADRDLAFVLDANRFDHPHQAIGDRPIDLWQVPPAKLLLRIGLDGSRRAGGETLGLAVLLEADVFRSIKSLLDTRPIFHKPDETIRGHVLCSFLALLLRKERQDRLERKEWKLEWADVVRDLDNLNEMKIAINGKSFVFRGQTSGVAGKVFHTNLTSTIE